MKKKLIVAIVIVCILLAAAVAMLVYLETRQPDAQNETQPGETVSSVETQPSAPETQPQESTEETVGISLPTENPEEVGPPVTFPEEGESEVVTTPPDASEHIPDEDENETPKIGF